MCGSKVISLKDILLFLVMHICICVWVFVHELVHSESRGIGSFGAGVREGCGSPALCSEPMSGAQLLSHPSLQPRDFPPYTSASLGANHPSA